MKKIFVVIIVLIFTIVILAKEKKDDSLNNKGKNIIEKSIKILTENGVKPDSDGMIFLERYKYYLEEINKGNSFSCFVDGKTPIPYNYMAFSNMIYSLNINKIVLNSIEKKDAFDGIKGLIERAYVSETDKSIDSYIMYIPKSYKPSISTPIIVVLHGYGGGAYISQNSPAHNGFLEACEKNGVIMVAPNGKNQLPKIITAYHNEGEKDVLQVINLVKKAYNIDAKKIYLAGESMGGHGTWYIGSRHNDIFAAIAPICGYGAGIYRNMPPVDVAALGNMPVFVYHGDSDKEVTVEEARIMVKKLKDNGQNVTYTEFKGVDHNAWDYAYNEELLKKLLECSK